MGAAKKVPLAGLIEKAANEFLSAVPGSGGDSMSCCAVWTCINRARLSEASKDAADLEFDRLVEEMGLYRGPVFSDVERGEERQQVRYAWLMLVAQVARERHIEV